MKNKKEDKFTKKDIISYIIQLLISLTVALFTFWLNKTYGASLQLRP